jgi:hypothetical protein
MAAGRCEEKMGVKLRNSIAVALSPLKSESIGSLTFFGSGSLFDRKEGTMSYLFQAFGGSTVLVDCGPLVFDKLHGLNVWKKIGAIVLTSSEESSMGSLASVVKMMQMVTDKPTHIICMMHVGLHAHDYLVNANNIPKESLEFHAIRPTDHDVELECTPSIRYTFRKTSDTSSISIMEVVNKTGSICMLHSGMIDRPAFEVLAEQEKAPVLSVMRRNPENTIVLHSASFKDRKGNCQFDKLLEWNAIYKNFLLFGHSFEEGNNINFSQRYMSSLSTKTDNVLLIEKQ